MVERLQEATLVLHLRLNELPVVQGIAMAEVPYRSCKALLSQQVEQSTEQGKRWTRTLSKEEQWRDAWISFVLAYPIT